MIITVFFRLKGFRAGRCWTDGQVRVQNSLNRDPLFGVAFCLRTFVILSCALTCSSNTSEVRKPTPPSIGSTSATASAAADSRHTASLAMLCKLWGFALMYHPHLVNHQDMWDGAGLEGIRKIQQLDSNDANFVAAASAMLGRLNDPSSFVRIREKIEANHKNNVRNEYHRLANNVLLIKPGTGRTLGADRVELKEMTKQVSDTIIDLRLERYSDRDSQAAYLDWPELLLNRTLQSRPRGYLLHFGFAPPDGRKSQYSSAFVTELPQTYTHLNGGNKHTVFLVNSRSLLPKFALAMQQSGDAVVIAHGPITETVAGNAKEIRLSSNVEAVVRTHEFVDNRGFRPDVSLSERTTNDSVIESALSIFARWNSEKRKGERLRGVIPRKNVTSEPISPVKQSLPSAEERVLALFKIWNIFDYFYPNRDLLPESWDDVLIKFLPKFYDADTSRAYALTVAELLTHVPDGHVQVSSPELANYIGQATPPFVVRPVEGSLVVTEYRDVEAARGANIQIGDVVVAVGEEPIQHRIARYEKFVNGSTKDAKLARIAAVILNGPEGPVAFTLRGHNEREKTVTTNRRRQFTSRDSKNSAIQLLPGNVAYVALGNLRPEEVDSMFERIKSTSAVVFDVREYTGGLIWLIPARLTSKDRVTATLVRRPLISAETGERTTVTFVQSIATTDRPKYTGKTIALIDERTISQAEHFGLFLQAANGTRFVGSRTAGADGDITHFSIPGGMRITFAGQVVLFPDGHQLQRVGIIPDVEVKPTIAGIRAGRDEVLERALELVRQSRQVQCVLLGHGTLTFKEAPAPDALRFAPTGELRGKQSLAKNQ